MCNIEKEHVITFVILCIVALILGYFIARGIETTVKEVVGNDNTELVVDETKELQDSIKTIKIKEDEELKVVRNANNDTVVIIFKELVSE